MKLKHQTEQVHGSQEHDFDLTYSKQEIETKARSF